VAGLPTEPLPADRPVSIQASFFSSRLWGTFASHLSNALVIALFAAAILSPWAIRNYRLFGKPIVTTTHGGYTLYLGNNESFYRYLHDKARESPWEATSLPLNNFFTNRTVGVEDVSLFASLQPDIRQFAQAQQQRGYGSHVELFQDYVAYVLARRAIRQFPRAFVYACLYRITQLWSPLPHKLHADESLPRRLLRYATCAWYLAVYALAAAGLWKLRWNLVKPPWLYALLLCLAFTAVHTFYWTNLRMRAPLMPSIALLAAAALLPSARATSHRPASGAA
jgi:hypothetical protein